MINLACKVSGGGERGAQLHVVVTGGYVLVTVNSLILKHYRL